MRTLDIKTIWAGRAWVHQKYLNEANHAGEGMILHFRNKKGELEVMTLPPEKIKKEYWQKGKEEYKDKFSQETYHLYGIVWKKDEMSPELSTDELLPPTLF